MTKEQIINSGNLEAYILGDLTPDETRKVEKYIALYPELKDELRQIEESLYLMAERTKILPRNSVKNDLLSKLEIPPEASKPLHKDHSGKRFHLMKAASIAFFLMSTLSIYILYEKERGLQKLYENLLEEHTQLISEKHNLNQALTLQNSRVGLVSNPGFEKITLISTSAIHHSNGAAYWNKSKGFLFLVVNEAPILTTEQDLQLWAIIAGQPVSAGVIKRDNSSILAMEQVMDVQAFAITVEPKGGSKEPTLEKVILSGAVSL